MCRVLSGHSSRNYERGHHFLSTISPSSTSVAIALCSQSSSLTVTPLSSRRYPTARFAHSWQAVACPGSVSIDVEGGMRPLPSQQSAYSAEVRNSRSSSESRRRYVFFSSRRRRTAALVCTVCFPLVRREKPTEAIEPLTHCCSACKSYAMSMADRLPFKSHPSLPACGRDRTHLTSGQGDRG